MVLFVCLSARAISFIRCGSAFFSNTIVIGVDIVGHRAHNYSCQQFEGKLDLYYFVFFAIHSHSVEVTNAYICSQCALHILTSFQL